MMRSPSGDHESGGGEGSGVVPVQRTTSDRGKEVAASPVEDKVYVATPVIDGNELKFVLPLQTETGASVEVPIPRPLLLPSEAKWPDHVRLLFLNYMNFRESGKPVRFAMYKDGVWEVIGKRLTDLLVSAFVDGKGIIQVETEGSKYFFDLYRMLGIDLITGTYMLISWVDVDGKSFLPKVYRQEDVDQLLGSVSSDKNKEAREELGKRKRLIEGNEVEEGECSSSTAKEWRVVVTELPSLPPKWSCTRSLSQEENLFCLVRGLFFLLVRIDVTVTAIHQCTRSGPREKARLEVFENSVETVRRSRGESNVVEYAWYGTSSENVESIIRRGFDFPRVIPGSRTRCLGISLSPVRSPQMSEMMADIDENGEKHLILCQVIVGRMEKVELGARQFFPSSADFDTGVDDLNNPKRYVVWCGNMNTHILPMLIVSYKYGHQVSGPQNGASNVDDIWSTARPKLNRLLPSPKVQELQSLYDSYQDGRIGTDIFMSQFQSAIGDAMLQSITLEIHGGYNLLDLDNSCQSAHCFTDFSLGPWSSWTGKLYVRVRNLSAHVSLFDGVVSLLKGLRPLWGPNFFTCVSVLQRRRLLHFFSMSH